MLNGTAGGRVPYNIIPSVGVAVAWLPTTAALEVTVGLTGRSVEVAGVVVRAGAGELVGVKVFSTVGDDEAGVTEGLTETGVDVEGGADVSVAGLTVASTFAVGVESPGSEIGRHAPSTKTATIAKAIFFM